jgi:hypothetical protein
MTRRGRLRRWCRWHEGEIVLGAFLVVFVGVLWLTS